MRNKKIVIATLQIILIMLMLVGIGNARVKRISYRQLANFFSNPGNTALKTGDTFTIELESLRDGMPNVQLAEAFERKLATNYEEQEVQTKMSFPWKRMTLEANGSAEFEVTIQRGSMTESKFLTGYLAQEFSEVTVNQSFADTFNYDLYQTVFFKDAHGLVRTKTIVGIVNDEILKNEYMPKDAPVMFVPEDLWKDFGERDTQGSENEIAIYSMISKGESITRTRMQELLQTAEAELAASFGEEGVFYESGVYTFTVSDSQNTMEELSKVMRERETEVPQRDVFIVLLLGFLIMLLTYYRFRLFRNDHITQWLDGKKIGKQVFAALCSLTFIVCIATATSVFVFETNKYNVMTEVVDEYDYVIDSLTESSARRYKEFIHSIWLIQVESSFETTKAMLMLAVIGGLFLFIIEIIAFTSLQPAKQYLDAVYYDEAGEIDD